MLAGTVVVGVQSVHPVEFLAVVLVRLVVGIDGGVRIRCTEGIVVRNLADIAVGIHHLTDTAKVVSVVVEEREVVGRRTRNRCLSVAALEEVFVNPAVLHHRKGKSFIPYYKIFEQESGSFRVPDFLKIISQSRKYTNSIFVYFLFLSIDPLSVLCILYTCQ